VIRRVSWGLAVRLYLSSFRMGDHPERLLDLIGADSRRAVVIANAMDDAPPDVRRAGVELELAALASMGLEPAELDLRGYFGRRRLLRRDLAGIGVAWSRGGNVFMLRHALARSGADAVFGELLAADALVYAGYSAGACVLSPGLRGLELVDDPDAVTRAYGSPPVWDGLALLPDAFVPHYRSPGHPETAAIELVVARYRAEGIPYRALHDGQALLINGPQSVVV
jgi:dipeptidase E